MRLGTREIVFILLLAGLPVGTWWFVGHRQGAQVAAVAASVVAHDDTSRELALVSRAIDRCQQDFTLLGKANKEFRARLPAGRDTDSVLKDAWRLAEAHNLTTRSIRVLTSGELAGDTKLPEQFVEQRLAMAIEGDFMGFHAFLIAIENQPRVMRLREMTISAKSNALKGDIMADLVISVYADKDTTGNPSGVRK